MDVVIVANAAYLPWCATTILSSAQETGPGEIRFHLLLGDDVSVADQERLRAITEQAGANIALQTIDESRLTAFPSKGLALGGYMSWVRVILPELLPDIDRVLYLDADTLVVTSLAEVWSTELHGAFAAAVPNVTEPAQYDHVRSLGIESPASYFNAGVLLLDLERWRAEDITTALYDFVGSREYLPWYDQDALNVVFRERWVPLHPRWNAMNSLWIWADYATAIYGADAVAEAVADPAILHFEGPAVCKPWHYLCDHPFRHRYRDVLGQTPWADTPMLDRTIGTRLIAALPSSQRHKAYARLWKGRQRVHAVRAGVSSRLRRS